MYTILTTYPETGCGNVGDMLIETAVRNIIEKEKGKRSFLKFFRENDLSDNLDEINRTRAVLLPGFPIRDLPMYPGVYSLVDDLRKIKVPLIPIGANWNVYPGDYYSRESIRYSKETVDFLTYVSEQTNALSCREYHTCRVLRKHGIDNTVMTGDPAWFDLDFLGKEMKRPAAVEKLVFTPPLSAFYEEQGKQFIAMLAKMFPEAQKYCCFHLADAITRPLSEGEKADNSVAMNPEVAKKNEVIRHYAEENGFEIVMANHDIRKLDFYAECDLHVGYECHAHWGFLRKRIPSVLIAEDARGVGFSYTQGVGGFNGFYRSQVPREDINHPVNTSGYCDTLGSFSDAPADSTVAERVREFIEDELESGFRRYVGFSGYLDEIYETRMKPFIADIP